MYTMHCSEEKKLMSAGLLLELRAGACPGLSRGWLIGLELVLV
jgi:hypothetical protein